MKALRGECRRVIAVLLVSLVPALAGVLPERRQSDPQQALAMAHPSSPALPRSSSVLSLSRQLMFPNVVGPMPSYAVTHPSEDTTVTHVHWPMCFGKHSAMLGRQVLFWAADPCGLCHVPDRSSIWQLLCQATGVRLRGRSKL